MQLLGRVRSLVLELEDRCQRGAYCSGELLHGWVRLELRGALRLRALEVCAWGRAAVHWLESSIVGFNVIYHDYTAYQTFLHRHCQLIAGKAGHGDGHLRQRHGLGTLWAAAVPSRRAFVLGVVASPSRAVPLGHPLPTSAASSLAASF